MRVIIIVLLLIVLGFIGWKAAERFKIIDTPQQESTVSGPTDNQQPAPDKPAEPALPSFDIVRVDRTGYAVIAGRAKPGSEVTIYANDDELAKTPAEADGSWVIATDVLQDPRDAPEGLGPLSLDVIDYDDTGAVIFSGRATPGRVVELYINRQLIGRVPANDEGRWTIAPEAQIAPGVYQLLVIQLDESGRPEYAIELPFERATIDQIQLRDGKVIVQPGNSLWRIARRAYGRGAQYTIIYAATASQIRNPDLIYPGQIFDVPDAADSESEGENGE